TVLPCWENCARANGSPQRNQWRKRRRRIDRSMIGEPTNFVHTTHVGSGDMGLGLASVDLVQAQMKSKGGYAHGGSEGSQFSQMSGREFKAQRKFAFQVLGSGLSLPGRYRP
ncbi:hypothetical protein INR49_031753, partial [Caranx melampygus]